MTEAFPYQSLLTSIGIVWLWTWLRGTLCKLSKGRPWMGDDECINWDFFVVILLISLCFRTQINEVEDVEQLYNDLMDLIVRLGNAGVIHGDFNEFNIMVSDDAKPILIDFPQMVSTSHINAKT